MAKTNNEKLNDPTKVNEIKEVTDPKAIQPYGGTKMLIAIPLEYDSIMQKIPSGKLITMDVIREHLAKKFNADYTCPLTAGIFVNMVAVASAERSDGKIPYWRTLKKIRKR